MHLIIQNHIIEESNTLSPKKHIIYYLHIVKFSL